jgi:UMF1 family MFS transporter
VSQVQKNDPRTIFGWAMYDWANSAYITTFGAIIAVFFAATIVPEEGFAGQSGETLWAGVVGFGSLILFLAMPILGTVADYAAAKRRFLRNFALLGAITTLVLPLVPDGAVGAFLFVALISQIGFVAANVFYDGFLPIITTDDTIDQVSSKGFAYGYIGGGLYLVLAFVLIFLSDNGTLGLSLSDASRISIAGAGVWWLLFSVITLRRLPDEGDPQPLPAVYANKSRLVAYTRIGFGATWETTKKLLDFRALLLFVVAYFLYSNGINTVIAVTGAYAVDTLELDTTEIVITFLIVQFVAFGGALFFGWLSTKIGTKLAIVISLLIWIGVTIAGYLLPVGQATPLYALGAVVGLVLGGSQALSRSLYGSMIPEESSAEFFGFFTVFSKASAVAGTTVFAIVSSVTGSGRPAILSVVGFFVVGLILLTRVNVDEGRASRDDWATSSARSAES